MEAQTTLSSASTACALLCRCLGNPGSCESANLQIWIVANLLCTAGINYKFSALHCDGCFSNVCGQDYLTHTRRGWLKDLRLLLWGDLRMKWQHFEALHVKVCRQTFLQIVDISKAWQEDKDGPLWFLCLALLLRLLLLFVHAVDVQDESLDDGKVEGEAALLQHIVLSQSIQQAGFVEGSHHLALQALIPQAPQGILISRCSMPEDHRLPGLFIPVTFATSRYIDASAEDPRPQKHSKDWLLVECGSNFIKIELTHREHAPRDFDLSSALEVALKSLHLQCGAHEHHAQVWPPLQEVAHEDHVEIRKLVALMDLVEDHMRDANQLRVPQQPLTKAP
mmetsp:Transcript_44589/g.83044  ORF Transcript_44589/g.83044 Transcript_44589/m.83044 type:complete len:337 (-) Transcript_44589:1029-2039(-)